MTPFSRLAAGRKGATSVNYRRSPGAMETGAPGGEEALESPGQPGKSSPDQTGKIFRFRAVFSTSRSSVVNTGSRQASSR